MTRSPRPLTEPERIAACDLCWAQPGERCTGPNGKPYQFGAHRSRKIAACGSVRAAEQTGFGFRVADAMRLRAQVATRYTRQQGQLSAYFDTLLKAADKAPREQRPELFDRIERVLAEVERRRLVKVRA